MNINERSIDRFIIGSSGFAAEIFSWLSSSVDISSVSFVVGDREPLLSPVAEISCCRDSDLVGRSGFAYMAIGNSELRQKIVANLKKKSRLEFPNLIHNSAIVDRAAVLGEGNLILPNAIVCPMAKIGSFSILNLFASLGHEAKIEDFVTLSPYATLNGKAECKSFSFLGTHSTVAPGVTIGESATLSANSFANKNVPNKALAYGVPAKIVERK
ncbi:acetyltransferase [Thiohalocapsa marina]|uniref:Acetyltransferase n=1 Tax=Thiohalocapsa marina TaxID=424902 RepID=A0A5M8FHN7_9GAMM|nr:acetyltransferase [Thiohalocapsa marina]KAA6183934.1 acetyltransferase [Thiohalocapsa marina]